MSKRNTLQSRGSQIKLGMVLSYLNLGLGNLVPFFYTPVMLSLLGQSEYGLYKLASSATTYLSLASFGIGSSVTRFLIKAQTEGGKRAEEDVFGLFYLIFQVIAGLVLILGAIITLNLGLVYSTSLTTEELARMKILVALMVVNTAVGFSASSYNAVVSAHERFVFIQCLNVLSTVVAPVVNLIVLFCGYRSIALTVTSLALNVIVRVVYVFYVRRVLDIRPRYNNLPVKLIKDILNFSLWIFVATLAAQLYNATDMVIIGAVPALATAGAAVYSIGTTFSSIMFSLAQISPSFFTPLANKMVFGGSSDRELTDLVIRSGRMQATVVALACFGFIAYGKPFICFYAGEEYAQAYWVSVLIMIPNSIPLVMSVANAIIQAKNMHKFRAQLYLAIAIVNVIGTLALVNRFGLLGCAIPTSVAYFIGHGIIMNWYYWKRVHLDIPRFWRNVGPFFGVSMLVCAGNLLCSRVIDFYQPVHFMLGVGAYTLVYGCLLWAFLFNQQEKAQLLGMLTSGWKKVTGRS